MRNISIVATQLAVVASLACGSAAAQAQAERIDQAAKLIKPNFETCMNNLKAKVNGDLGQFNGTVRGVCGCVAGMSAGAVAMGATADMIPTFSKVCKLEDFTE